ncbi:MAG: hypothetical protein Roseis2KO_28120 [Roseivirga sp.]
MKKGKFKAVIYLISFTVLVTVGIQVYRNMQNYNLNKQTLMNEVQQALDNGVESYYARLAKENQIAFFLSDSSRNDNGLVNSISTAWSSEDTLHDARYFQSFGFKSGQLADSNNNLKISVNSPTLTIKGNTQFKAIDASDVTSVRVITDSIFDQEQKFGDFARQIFISLSTEIDYSELHKSVADELSRKKLDIEFAFKGMRLDSSLVEYNNPEDDRYVMSTQANSTYQLGPEMLEMRYTNASLAILQRGLTDLIISLLISLTVIFALLYLYRVINQQKQLAEIKNDLISNITHEFKTPIATVTTALEGIVNFNERNDPGKTKKYLDISNEQLKKLNVMVEKLLETATLDTDALQLNKTPVNLSLLLHTMVEKYSMMATDKTIDLLDETSDVVIEADAFHIENAISNLIDNAVKYGGQHIAVSLARQQNTVQVVVQDNGGFIEKGHKERIFDKFYRIPKGNQHDVKGFGIGLYYSKKIIEKHGGTIELILAPNSTSFEVAI